MKTTNKLRITIKQGSSNNVFVLTVGKVSIIVLRRNMQAVYKSLLTTPLVESLANYHKSRNTSYSRIHLDNYLNGFTTCISDTYIMPR